MVIMCRAVGMLGQTQLLPLQVTEVKKTAARPVTTKQDVTFSYEKAQC